MKLTIAIPTYNRCRFLDDLLRSIRREWRDDYAGLCEVLVMDNASPDQTQEVANTHAAHLPLRYIRNPLNVGLQRNWQRSILNAQGEYFWVIGDDEEISRNSLENLLSVIQREKPAVIIGNYSYESEDRPLFLQSVRRQPLREGLSNCADFVTTHGLLWTFGNFGMVAGRSDLVRRHLDAAEQYFESNFAQVFFYYEAYRSESLYFCNRSFFVTDAEAQGPNKERWASDGTYREWNSIPKSMEILLGRCHHDQPRRPISFFNFCSNDWLPMWIGLYGRGLTAQGFDPDVSLACIAATKGLVDLVEPTVYSELLKSNLHELSHVYKTANMLLSSRRELCQRLTELSHETIMFHEVSL